MIYWEKKRREMGKRRARKREMRCHRGIPLSSPVLLFFSWAVHLILHPLPRRLSLSLNVLTPYSGIFGENFLLCVTAVLSQYLEPAGVRLFLPCPSFHLSVTDEERNFSRARLIFIFPLSACHSLSFCLNLVVLVTKLVLSKLVQISQVTRNWPRYIKVQRVNQIWFPRSRHHT